MQLTGSSPYTSSKQALDVHSLTQLSLSYTGRWAHVSDSQVFCRAFHCRSDCSHIGERGVSVRSAGGGRLGAVWHSEAQRVVISMRHKEDEVAIVE